MRRFIRDRKTKAFLAERGTWTKEMESALEFYNDNLVREARAVFRLRSCEIYYCFGTEPSKLDFAFSLARWLKSMDSSVRTKM